MLGHLDEANPSLIRGWFTPGSKAALTINDCVFEITNGSLRPDLVQHGFPAESGFLLTPENCPQIFQHLHNLPGQVLIRLFSNAKLQQILKPNDGVIVENIETSDPVQCFKPEFPREEDLVRSSGFSPPELKNIKEDFYKNGYCILPSFYTQSDMKSYQAYLDYLWSNRTNVDASLDVIDPRSGNKLISFKEASLSERFGPYKLNDLYISDSFTRQFTLSTRLSAVMAYITGGILMQCNSLNFEYGSQQDYHFDTFYMPHPNSEMLIVSSVCIEDVYDDAGPLSYWPKSHLCPAWINQRGTTTARDGAEHKAAIQHFSKYALEHKLTPQTFLGKSGDVFLWHQQLFHGGLPIKNYSRTRRSLVSHYWSYRNTDLHENFTAVNSCAGFFNRPHKC